MPDTKISALTTMLSTETAGGDKFVIMDVSALTTKAITRTELFKSAADVQVVDANPTVLLWETDGTTGYNGARIRRENDIFSIDTMADNVLVAVDYSIAGGASGGVLHIWRVAGVEKLRLHTNGFLGVATAAPLVELDVNGDSLVRGVHYFEQGAVTSKGVAATLTIAELLTNIIQYTGAVANLTLPLATDIVAGLPASFPNNMAFDFSVINTGSGIATVLGNTGTTLVGNGAVTNGTSGLFRVRKVTASTVSVYRIG